MYIKDGKRFNPHQTIRHGDVVYQGNVLAFPEVVAALGIEEIPEPEAPADFSDIKYFKMVRDTEPFVVYERKPDGMIREQELARQESLQLPLDKFVKR